MGEDLGKIFVQKIRSYLRSSWNLFTHRGNNIKSQKKFLDYIISQLRHTQVIISFTDPNFCFFDALTFCMIETNILLTILEALI